MLLRTQKSRNRFGLARNYKIMPAPRIDEPHIWLDASRSNMVRQFDRVAVDIAITRRNPPSRGLHRMRRYLL
jgi:hypothetical protein